MAFNILLEKYLIGKLTEEEELLFNEFLKKDTEKRLEVEFQLNLKKVASHVDEADFRKLITKIENQSRQPQIQKNKNTKWLVAASITLLLGLGYFYNASQTKATNTELFATYFEPYRNVIHPIVRGTMQQDKQSMAFMAYENGDFAKAVLLFNQLYSTTKEPYYLFYKANSLLKLNKTKEAIPLLLQHLKTKDTLTEKTHWYLALAYLKLEDNKKAKQELQKVIDSGSFKKKDAKKLLTEFN